MVLLQRRVKCTWFIQWQGMVVASDVVISQAMVRDYRVIIMWNLIGQEHQPSANQILPHSDPIQIIPLKFLALNFPLKIRRTLSRFSLQLFPSKIRKPWKSTCNTSKLLKTNEKEDISLWLYENHYIPNVSGHSHIVTLSFIICKGFISKFSEAKLQTHFIFKILLSLSDHKL